MKDKQLTIKDIIRRIGKGKCLFCGEEIDFSITYDWKVPLCELCKITTLEDLEEIEDDR